MLQLIRKRDKLYRLFLKSRCPEALKTFKKFRNFVTKQLRIAKKQYIYNRFNSTGGQSEKVWKVLKSIFGNSSEPTTKIIHEGIELKGADLADAFNDYFLSFADTSNSDVNLSNMSARNSETIFLMPVTVNEVITEFLSLNNSKATDASGFQIQPIKFTIDILAPCLAHIFNLSLVSGVFPRLMQRAKVIVIYKKGTKM